MAAKSLFLEVNTGRSPEFRTEVGGTKELPGRKIYFEGSVRHPYPVKPVVGYELVADAVVFLAHGLQFAERFFHFSILN
jgi:hypothetical protein